MNNQRKQIIFLAIAGIILVGVILVQVMRSGAPERRPAATTSAPTKTAVAAATMSEAPPLDPAALETLLAGIKQVTFNYPLNPGRDPMVPLLRDTVGPGLGGFTALGEMLISDPGSKVVSAIIGSPNQRYAVVDDEVVFPGYVYPDGVRVQAIHPEYVTFNVNDKLVDVPLKE